MFFTQPKDWDRVGNRMHNRLRSIESEMQEGHLNKIDDVHATGLIDGENNLSQSSTELYDFLTDAQDLANGLESPGSGFILGKLHSWVLQRNERQKL